MGRRGVRDEIVKAGLDVMHAQGFNGCSVQDITDTAGVPKGSFYNHFESKEALAVEVLRAWPSNDPSELSDRTRPTLDRLRSYFEKAAARSFRADGFKRGCLLGNFACELSDSSEVVRDAVAERFENWHRIIAEVLREGQAAGEVNPNIDPERMARFLVSSWEGAVMQMKVSKSYQPMEDFLAFAFISLSVG